MLKTNAVKFTYEDYRLFSGDKRYQIIEGERYMVPSPNIYHQSISGQLENIIRNHVNEKRIGKVFDAPCDVILSDENIVQPDILFISNEHLNIITEENVWGSPDLIIEIISPSTEKMDRIVKKKLYSRYGVREYWIVDPSTQTVEVMTWGDIGFSTIGIYGKEEGFKSPALGDLIIDLKKVF